MIPVPMMEKSQSQALPLKTFKKAIFLQKVFSTADFYSLFPKASFKIR